MLVRAVSLLPPPVMPRAFLQFSMLFMTRIMKLLHLLPSDKIYPFAETWCADFRSKGHFILFFTQDLPLPTHTCTVAQSVLLPFIFPMCCWVLLFMHILWAVCPLLRHYRIATLIPSEGSTTKRCCDKCGFGSLGHWWIMRGKRAVMCMQLSWGTNPQLIYALWRSYANSHQLRNYLGWEEGGG